MPINAPDQRAGIGRTALAPMIGLLGEIRLSYHPHKKPASTNRPAPFEIAAAARSHPPLRPLDARVHALRGGWPSGRATHCAV